MHKARTQKISTLTAIAIVVANMIGTGVFTSLGFQLQDLSNTLVILTLWILGGLLALSGAFSYVEIGTRIKKSGGEFSFLSELFSPFIGYLAGWVSLTVGFAAPVALSAIAVVEYFPFWDLDLTWTSVAIVGIITLIHSFSIQSSSIFQNTSTLLKVALIVVLITIGLSKPATSANLIVTGDYSAEVLSSAFAIALIYVSYSYSGWNAAVYITEEIKNPKKSLPYALIGGTLLVTVIYTLLQYVFLKHVPIPELVGQVNVGAIATQKMLGDNVGNLFGLAISLLLISGISAMVWIGPRVTSTMAKHFTICRSFQANTNQIPVRALWLQFGITTLLLLTGTFEQILVYCGFLLTLSSMFTVWGVFKIRKTSGEDSDHFKSPFFPLFQIIFIVFSLGMVVFIFMEKPREATLGLSNLLLGAIVWYFDKKIKQQNNPK